MTPRIICLRHGAIEYVIKIYADNNNNKRGRKYNMIRQSLTV